MKVVGRVVIVRNLSSCQRAIELPQVIDKQKGFFALVSAWLYCQSLGFGRSGRWDALARAVRERAAHSWVLCLVLG